MENQSRVGQIQMPEYHQSSIAMYLKCQKQYEFRHIRGMVVPPKSALTVGRAVDTGVTHNLAQKIETRTDVPLDEVLDQYSTQFDKDAPDTDWDGDDAGAQKDLGAKLVELYHRDVAPDVQPVAVQDQFRIEFESGYALGGTSDVIDENGFIRDTKTSKAKYDDDAVSNSLQATVYDYAYEAKNGKKAKGFIFDVLKKTKKPEYQKVQGEVSDHQREMTFEAINTMHENIKTGRFLPAPEGAWWCSKDWCGYWSLCKGKK